MNMKLYPTDYVITRGDDFVRFAFSGKIVIYGDKNEANEDCRSEDGERVVSCTELSEEHKQLLLSELN